MALCSYDSCEKPAIARGACQNHYKKMTWHGMKTCSMDKCSKRHASRGLCSAHYDILYKSDVILCPMPKYDHDKLCKIKNCNKESVAKALCDRHYRVWKKNGIVNPTLRELTVLERFHTKYKVNPINNCWEWTDYAKRYGSIRDGKKFARAHRFSYVHFNGKIPHGLYVCHKCDNTKCVNPEHLFLGTQQDNMIDMVKKGRNKNIKNKRGVL